MKGAALIALLALVACRPRQAAPAESRLAAEPNACSPCSYTDADGTFHIVDSLEQVPARYRPRAPRDARLWAAGAEDMHRTASGRCVAPSGEEIACRD